jgi:hypothetical protein
LVIISCCIISTTKSITMCYDYDCVTAVCVWFGRPLCSGERLSLEYVKSECCSCDRHHHHHYHLINDHQIWNSHTRGFVSHPRLQQQNQNLATHFWHQRPFGNGLVIILTTFFYHFLSAPLPYYRTSLGPPTHAAQ